jgi:hypothetical protein
LPKVGSLAKIVKREDFGQHARHAGTLKFKWGPARLEDGDFGLDLAGYSGLPVGSGIGILRFFGRVCAESGSRKKT